MIFGVFINGYKSYSKTNYIPICENDNYKFSTIVGRNGTGKSAVLEALNYFFRQGEWNENKNSKNKDDLFVTPVFLIEKESFAKWLHSVDDFRKKADDIIKSFDVISEFLWNQSDDYFKGATRRANTEEFLKRKNIIKDASFDKFYLVAVGKNTELKTTTKPFSSGFKSITDRDIDNVNEAIENYYNYIYIPVEQHAYSTLKIENVQMQKIMNRNVVRNIEESLDQKMNIDGKNKSFINHTNAQLDFFIEEINETIKQVDENYEFKAEKNKRQNIRPSDIIANILNAYFTKRTLKVSNKELAELSSGEQRRALIDIIYAFLKNRGMEEKSNGRNVILAIDEPEISQDVIHCFDQFERLEKLSNEFGNQVMVTTHWYGILPVIENGTLLHISENEKGKKGEGTKFSVFDFYNYLDEKRYFPDDVQLKSLYDLAISLNTYIKKDTAKHMIICEGSTDRRYLETLISPSKVRIIPVGGIDNVRNIYQLLVMPLQVENNGKNNNKKVLCLTDTDQNARDNTNLIKDKTGNIQLKRLQKSDKEGKLTLVSFDNFQPGQEHSVTRIEDVLHVETWIEVLKELIIQFRKEDTEIPFDDYEFIYETNFTNLQGDNSIIFTKTREAEFKKNLFNEFVESHKSKVSFMYTEKFRDVVEKGPLKKVPSLFIELNKFFGDNIYYDEIEFKEDLKV